MNYLNLIKDNFLRRDNIKNFFTYWLTSGFILAIALLVLDIISFDSKSIGIYAFLSGSFFFVNLLQFNVLKPYSEIRRKTFIMHTIFGGLIWVFYSIIMYVLYINNFSSNYNILITFISIIFISFIYFIKYEFINNFLMNFIK